MRIDINPAIDGLTEKIIGSAFTVSNTLGHGFLENVYKNALLEELSSNGLVAVKEKSFAVQYKGKQVGIYVADILIADCVIVELKAVDRLIKAHGAQLLNYLKVAKLGVGLLLNFGVPQVEVKRIINKGSFDEMVR